MIMISQVNMLVCLVNDILDRKLIELGQFETRREHFDPTKILRFIVSIFANQANLQGSSLSLHTVAPPLGPNSHLELFLRDSQRPLPDCLIGDQVRLQQVLVNLMKNALKFSRGRPIKILASYEPPKSILYV
mmetsp:Transcript_23563/g.31595  ORF Transcript_23563/g.31595 Transcript_23563/m.31595 type:complete len:132 (+) Transcript_23563:1308-1703(+)|eukprot:CAMPEP_0185596698 /NCGR_PEP_ID=MMETSP0434-20130131/80909_1 /TAXON_ID=626734 ORGANISM="Favella taraikaensis, Strain Fe Narragansett Bay" /NCGR_SAMPLE_ID=MMETSP0434 /ASSEMBLY_ACC=CAM_ASM_000379 /LENGTH=131 /DNA_ID=CAMNT_0028225245 /DNA_START=1255 /DNA_END=1650 /DNA_ORIENTATION=-